MTVVSNKNMEALGMAADHYLCGCCEGMSLHTNGAVLTLQDKSGREPEKIMEFENSQEASAALWVWREELYKKYGDDLCL
jgi:hypothetical protein